MALHPSLDAPAGATGSTATRRRTRMLTLLALGCVLAAVLAAGRGHWDSHRARWWGPAGADLALDLRALSPAMDEAALLRHFSGAALACTDGMDGQRLCAAPLAHVDGVTAARLQAWLANGRLQAVEVWVPWWEHHNAARALVARFGAPAIASRGTATQARPSIAWELPGGWLHIDRHPGWNPWRWTTLHWAAHTSD